MNDQYSSISPAERDALKQDFFMSLHCALPGIVESFDDSSGTASVRLALSGMPVPFEIHPGDACLVVFSDVDIDAWLQTGEASVPSSARRHSLSDGFAFVGFRTG